jgi:hypothetical protein
MGAGKLARMTNRAYYDNAVRYMSSTSYTYAESVALISELFNVNPAIVREDIRKARKGEYKYGN